MDADRWERIQSLYAALDELPTQARLSMLSSHDDVSIAQDVASMFFTDGPGSRFLQSPQAQSTRAASTDDLLVERYRLMELLGEGSQGQVFAAWDLLTGSEVAVKLMQPQGDGAWLRARRESAALRHLRLPGVLRLLDDGRTDDGVFVVTERVHGSAFPGAPTPMAWREFKPLATAFLDALLGIHRAGVVHGDLKPSNVLVDDGGRVTILDLGIAGGPAVWTHANEGGAGGGTPAYMAPELLLGQPHSVQSDLFAAGMMLFQALAGRLPFKEQGVTALIIERTTKATPSIRGFVDGLPDAVAEGIDRMLALEPADRTTDLEAVAREWLDPDNGLEQRVAAMVNAAPEAVDLFLGPERIFHTRTDAAAELVRRAGSDPARWARELLDWVRAGFATLEGERLRIPPNEIGRFRSAGEMLEVSDTWSGGLPSSVVELSINLATRGLTAGRFDLARSAIEEGLVAAREAGDAPGEEQLLALLARTAAGHGRRVGFDQLLYQLGRVRKPTPLIAQLEQVARSAVAGFSGDWRQGVAIADACAPFDAPELELLRRTALVRAARRAPIEVEQEHVEDAARWVEETRDPEHAAVLLVWRGWIRYRQGDYAAAAELQAQGAQATAVPLARATARLDAASSYMEAANMARASGNIEAAWTVLASLRSIHLEARAAWLERAIAYRSEVAMDVDDELLAAIPALGLPYLEAAITLTEAAVCWRNGQLQRAATLSRLSADTFVKAGRSSVAVLPLALETACHQGATTKRDWLELLESCKTTDIMLQAAALLVSAGVLNPNALESARKRADALAKVRLDVLSGEEVTQLLRRPSTPR